MGQKFPPVGVLTAPSVQQNKGDVMDSKQVAQMQIQALENELSQIYSNMALYEAKVADATEPTGNAQVDLELKKVATEAAKVLLTQKRMVSVREAQLVNLRSQLDEV